MKIITNFLFIVFLAGVIYGQDSVSYKSNIDFGGGFVLSTYLFFDHENSNFTMNSPKNADKRIAGGFKSFLGRLSGKLPQKGIILKVNGNTKNDSLFGTAKMFVLGKFDFKGLRKDSLIKGVFYDKDGSEVAQLESQVSDFKKLNFQDKYSKINLITKKNIYSKEILNTKEWRKFDKKLRKISNKAIDDIEFLFGFNLLSQNLPFSHYNLLIQKQNTNQNKDNIAKEISSAVEFEEKNQRTAYLKIKNFTTSKKELTEVLPTIVNKKYNNLIIDLRNNGGGGVEAAFELAKYLIDKKTKIGYFISNDFRYSAFTKEMFDDLEEIEPKSTKQFTDYLLRNRGAIMVFNNLENSLVFKGKLYVLTNNKTASTCEPIVYLLKNKLNATIVGEKTAGAMLSAKFFNINEKYKLMLPIADFYTYDGFRIEGIGVSPNIETESSNALEKVIKLLPE